MYNRPSIFQGRNGSDQLSVFLVAVALVLVIIYPFFSIKAVRLALCAIALLLCAISVFRMFSSNIAKRRAENDKFLSIFKRNGRGSSFEDVDYKDANTMSSREKKKAEREKKKNGKKARKEDLKTHAYFKCPKCSTSLRVPRGKGKIKITCPKCGEQFVEKT